MSTRASLWCVVILVVAGSMMWLGCEKKEDGTPSAVQSVKDASAAAADKAKDMGQAAAAKASDVASAVTAEAQKYIDQINAFIKDKKWDEADGVLKKLEAMKDKLPAEWAAKVESAKQMLDKAKAAVGNAMPAAGGAGVAH